MWKIQIINLFVQYPVSQWSIQSANPHRFSSTVIVRPIFAYWTGCACVPTLQLETHQSIIGQIYSRFVHQKHWRENPNWRLCWISCNHWLCLYFKIIYSRKRWMSQHQSNVLATVSPATTMPCPRYILPLAVKSTTKCGWCWDCGAFYGMKSLEEHLASFWWSSVG